MSTPTFMAANSAPNTDVSMVDCLLEYLLISGILTYVMNLVIYLLAYLLTALPLSMNIHRSTSLPLGGGALGGIGSAAPSVKSVQSHSWK